MAFEWDKRFRSHVSGKIGLVCLWTHGADASARCPLRPVGMKRARVCCQTTIELVELRMERELRSVPASQYSDAGAQGHLGKRKAEQLVVLDVLAEHESTREVRMREC